MILLALLGALTGLLTEIVDTIEDEKRFARWRWYSLPLGIMYGVLIAYSIFLYPSIAPLALGVIIGLYATGKIDAPGHYAGTVAMLLLLLYRGWPQTDQALLVLFMMGSVIDEVSSDFSDRKKARGPKGIFGMRLCVEIIAILVSLTTGHWEFFVYIFSYDIVAYLVIERLLFSFLSKTK